jgi:hypothetical protein
LENGTAGNDGARPERFNFAGPAALGCGHCSDITKRTHKRDFNAMQTLITLTLAAVFVATHRCFLFNYHDRPCTTMVTPDDSER